jgi:hypothetical protein
MANDHGFNFEDSCDGGHFYAATPLQYVSIYRYVAVIPGFYFIFSPWSTLIACAVLQHKNSSLVVELRTKFLSETLNNGRVIILKSIRDTGMSVDN